MAPPLTGKSLIPHPPTEGEGSMKRTLCSLLVSLLVATLPFGSVLADAPKSKNAKVTLVYQHELPNVPGKSIKGVLVEYGPGGYSPGHTHPKSAFIPHTLPPARGMPPRFRGEAPDLSRVAATDGNASAQQPVARTDSRRRRSPAG